MIDDKCNVLALLKKWRGVRLHEQVIAPTLFMDLYNICIHFICVDYVGKGAHQELAMQEQLPG